MKALDAADVQPRMFPTSRSEYLLRRAILLEVAAAPRHGSQKSSRCSRHADEVISYTAALRSGDLLCTAALLEAAAHGKLGDLGIWKEGHGGEGPGFAGGPTGHPAQGPALVEVGFSLAQEEFIQRVHDFAP